MKKFKMRHENLSLSRTVRLQPVVINHYYFFDNGPQCAHADEETLTESEETLIIELSPFFFGYRDEARSFLGKIKGAKPTQITSIVNALIKERKISSASCGKPLWTLLHDYGLYLPELRNWNYFIETN